MDIPNLLKLIWEARQVKWNNPRGVIYGDWNLTAEHIFTCLHVLNIQLNVIDFENDIPNWSEHSILLWISYMESDGSTIQDYKLGQGNV